MAVVMQYFKQSEMVGLVYVTYNHFSITKDSLWRNRSWMTLSFQMINHRGVSHYTQAFSSLQRNRVLLKHCLSFFIVITRVMDHRAVWNPLRGTTPNYWLPIKNSLQSIIGWSPFYISHLWELSGAFSFIFISKYLVPERNKRNNSCLDINLPNKLVLPVRDTERQEEII